MIPTLSEKDIKVFQETILSFYDEHERSFPWRETQDPYKIWVSEVMLQQTQANRVIPKYEDWMKTFPTVKSLAQANMTNVLEQWKGLGYNNRAKWLRDAAKKVIDEYEGELPTKTKELETLKGVGPYTSRAIQIFAHNMDQVTVDTNIRRIFISEFDLDKETSTEDIYPLARQVLPRGKSREWHNALMDYGALKATSQETGVKPETTQGTFKGSNRWYRSKVLQQVMEKSRSITQVEEEYGEKGMKAVRTLRKDDMIKVGEDGKISLPK